jgi:phosphatidyl-myo-inositol alpha-mannosyltransferase
LVRVDDSAALGSALTEVLSNDATRERYVEAASKAVRRYDWSVVAHQILRVYETVSGSGVKVRVAGTSDSTREVRTGRGEVTRGTE